MTWPIGTPISMAARRMNDDIADLARDSTALKRENAELRRQLLRAQDAVDTLRTAHAIQATELLKLRAVVQAVAESADAHPHWPLLRWVRFGPVAAAIDDFKNGKL